MSRPRYLRLLRVPVVALRTYGYLRPCNPRAVAVELALRSAVHLCGK